MGCIRMMITETMNKKVRKTIFFMAKWLMKLIIRSLTFAFKLYLHTLSLLLLLFLFLYLSHIHIFMINFSQFPPKVSPSIELPWNLIMYIFGMQFHALYREKEGKKTKSLFSHPTIAHQLLITRYHNIAVIKIQPKCCFISIYLYH